MPAVDSLLPAAPVAAAAWRIEAASLLRLAAPIVVGLCASASMAVVDSAVVAPLGGVALAAVALTGSVMLVFVAALYGFLSAAGIFAARAHGAGDRHGLAAHRAAGVRLALQAGFASAALMLPGLWLLPWLGQPAAVLDAIGPYWVLSALSLPALAVQLACKQMLDAIDRPWTGVAVSLAMVAVNAGLGLSLVSAGGGLAGAAAATLIAYLAGAAATWALLRRHTAAPGPVPVAEAAIDQRREGLPMGLQYLLECGATAAAGVLIGLFGVAALAAHQIAMSVTMALYMLPLGLAAAVGLRMSQRIGAGQVHALRPLAVAALALTVLWMGGFGVLLALAGHAIALAFTPQREAAAAAAALFAAMAIMQVADGVQSVSLGALRGLLDNRWPTRVSLGCYWLIALPAGWLCAGPLRMGPAGIWVGFGCGLAVAAAALAARLHGQIGRLAPASSRLLGQQRIGPR